MKLQEFQAIKERFLQAASLAGRRGGKSSMIEGLKLVNEVERLNNVLEQIQNDLIPLRGATTNHDGELTGICIRICRVLAGGEYDEYDEDEPTEETSTDQPIRFKPLENIYWEDWGRFPLVFKKGEIYEGTLHEDGTVTAETPYFQGISDYVDTELIEIEKCQQTNIKEIRAMF